MSKTKSYFGVVICAFLASLFVSGLYNNIVFAASASISTTGTVNIDVSAAGNSANIGSDMLTVDTTCSTGYTVSISSSINDTTLYKDGDSTSNSRITPSTGTASTPVSILGDNLGTWGYSMTDSTVNGAFTGLSSTQDTIKASTTASATGGDKFPVYYGVSIPAALEPGTYTMAKDSSNNPATIVYQLTMPIECQTYTIKYDGNGADSSTTMSVVNEDLNTNDTTTLMPSNYKRAGYGFAGWNTKADGTGENFGPMEDVTLSTSDTKGSALLGAANADKEITLYAKWIQSQGNIQSWSGCSSLASGAVTALTDTRDNNVYAVAKLADGNCWMIENLRLGGNSTMNLTAANTVTAFTLPASTNTFATTSSDYTAIQMSAKNTLEASADMAATNAEVYSYGNYYSWPAAIGSTTAYSTSNQSVNTSICPSGWHLPKGGNNQNTANNEFLGLSVALTGAQPANYSSSTYPYYTGNPEGTNATNLHRKYPNNFLYSGYLHGSSFNYRGSNGYYWSSTVNSSSYSGSLYLYASRVYPGTNFGDKYYGFSVRCVADTTYTVNFSANGGSGTMNPQIINSGTPTPLNSNNFSRSYYTFNGWNTASNGTGTSYSNGQSVTDIAATGSSITLHAMWRPYSYTIAYNANGGSGTTSASYPTYNSSHTLRSNNFSRTNYTFLGWSTSSTASSATYSSGQYLTAAQVNSLVSGLSNGGTKTLYAVWQYSPPTISSISTMQEMTSAICSATSTGTEKQLRDTRDNKTYWVAKLQDGKCWMTQNLDLDLSTSKALTPSDSDVTANWTPTRGTINASSVTNNSISGWSNDYNTPYSVDPGNWYWNALPFYSYTNNNFLAGSGGTKFQKNTPYANNGEHGHVGNYYNWSAAVAMNSTSSYTASTYSNPANNPQTSICPKGWRLPTASNASNTTAGSTNEFGRLNQLYNSGSTSTSQNLEAAPLYFVRSGYVDSSQQVGAGAIGGYWSSSVGSSGGAYILYFYSSSVNPTYNFSRNYGFSVRCVAR